MEFDMYILLCILIQPELKILRMKIDNMFITNRILLLLL